MFYYNLYFAVASDTNINRKISKAGFKYSILNPSLAMLNSVIACSFAFQYDHLSLLQDAFFGVSTFTV